MMTCSDREKYAMIAGEHITLAIARVKSRFNQHTIAIRLKTPVAAKADECRSLFPDFKISIKDGFLHIWHRRSVAEFVKIDASIQTKALSSSPLTFPARFRLSLDKGPIIEEPCVRNRSFH
ncbi:MAG: hypothetical protein IKS20_06920 [Victivallales bacterium]|nr:hypothetical protein [Victivallales bacterium]